MTPKIRLRNLTFGVNFLISYSKYFFIGDYGGIAAESFFYTDIPCIVYRLNHLVKLFLAALYLHCHRAIVLVAHLVTEPSYSLRTQPVTPCALAAY